MIRFIIKNKNKQKKARISKSLDLTDQKEFCSVLLIGCRENAGKWHSAWIQWIENPQEKLTSTVKQVSGSAQTIRGKAKGRKECTVLISNGCMKFRIQSHAVVPKSHRTRLFSLS